jgi:hypothetical protein
VVGLFTAYRGTARQYIAKLNATTAALDVTFDSATGFNAQARTITSDGTYLYVGGEFTTYKGSTRQYIAKINSTTAALDGTFNTVAGFNNFVRGKLTLDSGYLYVGGHFTTYKGTARLGMAKINATDATLDTTFDTSVAFSGGVVLDSIISGDIIYSGGTFTLHGSISRLRLAILNRTYGYLDGFAQETTLTNVNGYYIFENLDNSTYLVNPPVNAYTYNPVYRNAVILNNYVINADFDTV